LRKYSTSFNKRYDGTPTELVKEILKETECHVIISPASFDGIAELIFAYDGSKSAAFAIKQFTYLFPEFTDRKAIVLRVNKEGL
jgi:hypothetical protein